MLTLICAFVIMAIVEGFVNNEWKLLNIVVAIVVITYISSQIFY